MEYSELAEALKEDDTSTINACLKTLRPRLICYLRIELGANMTDAEDCVQQALLHVLETIKAEKLRKPERIYSFLLSSCRNAYLNMMQKQQRNNNEHYTGEPHLPNQLNRLLAKERRQLLMRCLQKLQEDHRAFISHWFSYPGADALSVARRFGISVNNVWTRKHRILKKLSRCYQKQSAD